MLAPPRRAIPRSPRRPTCTGYARAADGTPAYVLVVLTQGLHDLEVGVTLIESIAQALHDALAAETRAVPLAEAVRR